MNCQVAEVQLCTVLVLLSCPACFMFYIQTTLKRHKAHSSLRATKEAKFRRGGAWNGKENVDGLMTDTLDASFAITCTSYIVRVLILCNYFYPLLSARIAAIRDPDISLLVVVLSFVNALHESLVAYDFVCSRAKTMWLFTLVGSIVRQMFLFISGGIVASTFECMCWDLFGTKKSYSRHYVADLLIRKHVRILADRTYLSVCHEIYIAVIQDFHVKLNSWRTCKLGLGSEI